MYQPLFTLTGKRALVTGAGRGMGLGIARALARQGARVAVNDALPERAREAAECLVNEGHDALAAPADITDPAQLHEMVAGVQASWGGIDIFAANAGVPVGGMTYGRFLESAPEEWKAYIDLNLYGLMHGCQAVLPGMLEQGWGGSSRLPQSPGGPACPWESPPTPLPRPVPSASSGNLLRRPAARASPSTPSRWVR